MMSQETRRLGSTISIIFSLPALLHLHSITYFAYKINIFQFKQNKKNIYILLCIYIYIYINMYIKCVCVWVKYIFFFGLPYFFLVSECLMTVQRIEYIYVYIFRYIYIFYFKILCLFVLARVVGCLFPL